MQFQIEAQKATREADEAKSELSAKEKLLNSTEKELRSLQVCFVATLKFSIVFEV